MRGQALPGVFADKGASFSRKYAAALETWSKYVVSGVEEALGEFIFWFTFWNGQEVDACQSERFLLHHIQFLSLGACPKRKMLSSKTAHAEIPPSILQVRSESTIALPAEVIAHCWWPFLRLTCVERGICALCGNRRDSKAGTARFSAERLPLPGGVATKRPPRHFLCTFLAEPGRFRYDSLQHSDACV